MHWTLVGKEEWGFGERETEIGKKVGEGCFILDRMPAIQWLGVSQTL
jgi:hypothetical protein